MKLDRLRWLRNDLGIITVSVGQLAVSNCISTNGFSPELQCTRSITGTLLQL